MIVVIYSGFLISESILPDFGVEPVANELAGLASVAGLNKVLVFLGLGALIARPLRRRLRGVPQ